MAMVGRQLHDDRGRDRRGKGVQDGRWNSVNWTTRERACWAETRVGRDAQGCAPTASIGDDNRSGSSDGDNSDDGGLVEIS